MVTPDHTRAADEVVKWGTCRGLELEKDVNLRPTEQRRHKQGDTSATEVSGIPRASAPSATIGPTGQRRREDAHQIAPLGADSSGAPVAASATGAGGCGRSRLRRYCAASATPPTPPIA